MVKYAIFLKVWDHPTPPNHIWVFCPKKNLFFLGASLNVLCQLLSQKYYILERQLQIIELFLLFDSTIGTYLMEICTEIARNYLCVWLFHILYMWCRQLKFQTIDKTIGALETYSIMEYELFFATLPLSWFQILLTVESPAQVLIICALCHAHPAHQTKHSPVLWRKALCTIVEAGLGMGGSEVHRVDNILWKPTW